MAEDASQDAPPDRKANILVRTYEVQYGSAPPFLIVEIEIDCAVCGETNFRVMGHHIRGLIGALQELADQHGDLCGSRKALEPVGRDHWQVQPPKGDPNLN